MTIRQPVFELLNAEYEVYDGPEDDNLVGHAIVEAGTIQKLYVRADASEDYRGQILTSLMASIIGEADRINSNLSIRAAKPTMKFSRFLERHGFQCVGGDVFKRVAGSVRPPSVIY
jgi:hypothetical protein